MSHQTKVSRYLLAFIHGLKEAGVKKAVISPGSRSTPLALLLDQEPAIECYIHVDERSSAFFALGLAKASKEPVAVVCTSGTAAANVYPAVCEAEASYVPLVILTTDRPPELQGVGAPQTMNQHDLYQDHVKKFVAMPVPEASENALRASYWQALNAVLASLRAPAGPVHINLPFREPLVPDLTLHEDFPARTAVMKVEKRGEPLPETVTTWLEKKGLIVVGDEVSVAEARHLLRLAEQLRWPIVGDPLTNLATCGRKSKNYLKQSDVIFSSINSQKPEVVLRFGKLPVTKNVLLYLTGLVDVEVIFIDEKEQWHDQLMSGNWLIPLSIRVFCETLEATDFTACDKAWLQQWQALQENAQQTVRAKIARQPFDESVAACALPQLLPENCSLFLSNSNAIRLVDRLSEATDNKITIYGNRGVNGIDGLISTTAGIAAAVKEPTYLLIGDLAFFHDMNGLQLLKEHELPVTIVLLNNNGGGIFSFLPQKTLASASFDRLFATPLNLEFQQAAALYEGEYLRPTTFSEFQQMIQTPATKWRLIEVVGEQQAPVALWEEILRTYQQGATDEARN